MHREPRSPIVRILVALGAMIAAAISALALAGVSNAAAAGDSVLAGNNDVKAQCAVNTETVNTNGDTVYYLSSQAYPATLAGYLNNKYTQVDCTIKNSNGAVLSSFSRSVNASWLPQTRNSGVILPPSQYQVCARGFVKLTTNATSDTGTVCTVI